MILKHVIKGENLIKIAWESFLANIDDYLKKKKSQSKLKRSQLSSNVLHLSLFCDRQWDKKLQIACSYPHEPKKTIPATWLYPVSSQIIDDSKTHMTTEDDNNLIYKLVNVMSALYETENKQVDAVSKILARYSLRFCLNSKVQETAYMMDADMSLTFITTIIPLLSLNQE